MKKTVLIDFLKETDYEQMIEQEFQEDYLEELCRCSMYGIPVEDYQQFINEDSSAKGNTDELAEWRERLVEKMYEPENIKVSSDAENEEEIRLLQEENEFLTSQYMEQKSKISKLEEELALAKEEEESYEKEIKERKASNENLETENKRLKDKINDLQLSLNENLIAHSVIEKKKYHEVPKCRSDVEFATYLFERERRLTKEQRGFVFECFNRKIPHHIIWQNVSAGYDVALMRNLVDLAVKEEEESKKTGEKKKDHKKKKHLFARKEDKNS